LAIYQVVNLNVAEGGKNGQICSEFHSLPSGIELVGEYDHAWGIEYNGFLLFEADSSDSFLE
jgi:hypothetical protein